MTPKKILSKLFGMQKRSFHHFTSSKPDVYPPARLEEPYVPQAEHIVERYEENERLLCSRLRNSTVSLLPDLYEACGKAPPHLTFDGWRRAPNGQEGWQKTKDCFFSHLSEFQSVTELDLSKERKNTSWYYLNYGFSPLISCLKNLKTLSLRGQEISLYPNQLSALRQVENLDLSNCKLEVIPLQLFELTKLKKLNLSNNNLKTLPKLFYHSFPELEELNLTGNPLEKDEEFVSLLGVCEEQL